MKTSKNTSIACALTLLLLGHPVQAATDTWQGGTTTWAAGFSPSWTAGDTAQFNGTGTQTVVVNLGAAQTATGITVNAGQTGTILMQGGGANQILSLGSGGISMDPGVGTFTIGSATANQNVTVDLTASQSWSNNSSSLFTDVNAITNAGNVTPFTLTINGSGTGGTTLSGIISNGGATGTTALTVNTTGGVTFLGAANTFTGGFTLNSGTVVTHNFSALGAVSDVVTLNGGTLDLENTLVTTNPGPIAAYNTVVGGDVTIKSGVSAGTTGNAYLFGTLSIGSDTLTATQGSNATSGYRVQFASTTLTGNATLDAEKGALLVIGAGGTSAGLAGNFNLTVQSQDGTGSTSIRAGAAGTRSSGTTTFQSGANNLNGTVGTILGTTGTTLVLNGGSLDFQISGGGVASYNTTVGGNFTLTNNINNVAQKLGTLSMGAFILTTGSSLATGTENLSFGATTFSGGTSTFNVNNNFTSSASTSTLTLGALNDGGTAVTIVKTGNSSLILGTATTGLTADDQIDISTGTLSSTNATALGTATGSGVTVDVADGAIFNVGASQTIGALTNTTGIHTANSGSVTLGAFNLTIGSTANLGGTFGGVISGTGGIIKAGTGTETLSGASTYTGATTVNGGVLSVSDIVVSGGNSNIGNAASAVGLNGGDLSYTGTSATYTRGFTIGTNGGELDTTTAGQTLTIATGAITGTGNAFTVGGAGNTTITSAITTGVGGTVTKTGSGTLTLSGTNTYTGGTNLNGGTVSLGGGIQSLGGTGTVASIGTISFGGGTLQFSAANTTDYSSKFSNASGQAYSIDTNGQNVTFASSLTSSSGTFTLDDTSATTGILTFTAVNSYNGLTSVVAGELDLDKVGGVTISGDLTVGDGVGAANTATVKLLTASQIGTGSNVTINSDGRLDLNDFIDQVSSLSMFGGDIISSVPGGNLTVNGATTINGSGNTIGTGVTVTTSGTATMGSGATLEVDGTLSGGLTVGNGTVSGTGTVTGNATMIDGTIDFGSGGSISGTLGVTGGGNWNGLGSVTGAVTSSSGDFNVGSGANLTTIGGLHVTGGTLSGSGTIQPRVASGYGITVATGASITPGGLQPTPMNPANLANGNLTLDPTNNPSGNLLSVATGSTLAPSFNFALGASNSSSQIVVAGSTGNIINFNVGGTRGPGGTSSVISINDLIGANLTVNQNYVLIAGNGNTTFEDNGLSLAAAGDLGATVDGHGQLIIGGLSLLAANTDGNFFSQSYGNSELFLNGDNIEIEVIPEPGTWAMMVGGLALLAFIQHRKRSRC